MLLRLILLLLPLGITLAQAQPAVIGAPEPVIRAPELVKRIDEALEAAALGPGSRLSIIVQDPVRGVSWVSKNADEPVVGASLQKLITAAAALDILGPDRTFVTRLEADGDVVGEVVRGNLIIRGGGDPTFGPRGNGDHEDITRVFKDWAKRLKKSGVRTINGNIYGDDTRYLNDPTAVGWEPSELGEWYSAEVSALTFNENTVDFVLKSGDSAGSRARFDLLPDTDYVTPSVNVRVGSPSLKRSQLRFFRFAESNDIRVRGIIPADSQVYDFAAVHEPARYAAHLLKAELERVGIKVAGRAERLEAENADDVSSQTVELESVTSMPLSEMMPIMLGDSHNLYAEIMMREVALATKFPADFRGGTAALMRWLRSRQLHETGLVMMDGSGLSSFNRTPPIVIARMLRFLYGSPHRELVMGGLASPGYRALSQRFAAPKFAPLANTLRAKTGFLIGCHALAGYVSNAQGTEYSFVIILNGYDSRNTVAARNLVDDLVLEIHDAGELP